MSSLTDDVDAAANYFLRVFDDLAWDKFADCWSEEPSVFFPFDDARDRFDGREEVLTRFRRMFEEVRASVPGPPFLHLRPMRLTVTPLGDAALVTFQLGDGSGSIGRRTLVFIPVEGKWKLAHLHASNSKAVGGSPA